MSVSRALEKDRISDEAFSFFRELAYRLAGIALGEEKRYFLEDRLGHLVRSEGLESIEALYRQARVSLSPDLKKSLIDALTTNETLFFRDSSPFEFLAHGALDRLRAAKKDSRVLRVWSAACSSGQEVYSFMMTLAEHAPDLLNWNLDVVATDISDEILGKARKGVYTHLEIQRGVPMNLLARYFTKHDDGWAFDENLRKRVTFKKVNLLEPFAGMGQFDIIFSRYVLIYFDVETKRTIFEKFHRAIHPEGILFLGASEGLFGVTNLFGRQTDGKCVYYQRS